MKPCIVCMYHGCEEMIRKVRETLANTEALEDSTCNHYRAPRRVQTLIERNLPGHKQKPLPFTYIQPLPSTTATLSNYATKILHISWTIVIVYVCVRTILSTDSTGVEQVSVNVTVMVVLMVALILRISSKYFVLEHFVL